MLNVVLARLRWHSGWQKTTIYHGSWQFFLCGGCFFHFSLAWYLKNPFSDHLQATLYLNLVWYNAEGRKQIRDQWQLELPDTLAVQCVENGPLWICGERAETLATMRCDP